MIKECMNTVGMDYVAPNSEWPWNVISKRAVAYSCGKIAREGEKVEHNHDPGEFELCEVLADEAEKVMAGSEVGMGSEAALGTGILLPFFVVANVGKKTPQQIDEGTIRDAFGGTIYPPTKIWIEPLIAAGEWWAQVLEYYRCFVGEERETHLRPWRKMMKWFRSREEFQNTAFVMIGEDPLGGENGGCAFPRLALGLTHAGSLAGIASYVVHT
jgi:hypothetical protein